MATMVTEIVTAMTVLIQAIQAIQANQAKMKLVVMSLKRLLAGLAHNAPIQIVGVFMGTMKTTTNEKVVLASLKICGRLYGILPLTQQTGNMM